MKLQTRNSIGLSNGDFFDFDSPETHQYDIKAIAQSLAKICRFNGHNDGDAIYSVAEHSYLVSLLVPQKFALEGLMHDSSEAFTGDMQKPLKEMLPAFKKIEDRIERAIAKYYRLHFPYPPSIKLADKSLYQAERRQVATSVFDGIWNKADVADVKINCWPVRKAREMFLNRFEELYNDRNAVLRSKATEGAAAA